MLFLARIVVSCSENRTARGAAQELPCIGIGSCLRLARHLFLKHFLERLFSQKYRNLPENYSQNDTNSGPFFIHFWRKANTQKVCWNSSENPSGRVLGGPKITEKTHLYKHMFYTPVFSKKIGKSMKKKPNMGPKTRVYFRGGRLGALLGHLLAPESRF